MPPCLITYQRQKSTFGYFSRERFGRRDGRRTDEIALNPEYFAVVPSVEVLQTLVHEMTHLWQHHFGKPSRACYHNGQWADKMESIGLMPSSTGQPGGKRVGQKMADYVIPGGRFEQVTTDLLGSGFMISWLDRYPAQPPGGMGGYLPLGPTESGDEKPGGTVGLPASAFSIPLQDAQVAVVVEQPKSENRSNRSKFTCPSCGINLWGKPGLRVMCMDCSAPLAEGG